MKKKTLGFLASSALILLLIIISCHKNNISTPSVILSPNNKFEKPFKELGKNFVDSANKASGVNSFARQNSPLTPSYGCGSFLSGNYYGNGYHRYPDDTINVSSSEQGSRIDINVNSYDVPDRFTVYDSVGNIVANSGWMGYVNYPGPWGTSLNTPETQVLTFHYGTSSTFRLVVETVTSTVSDSWDASVSCAYVPNFVSYTINNPTLSSEIQNTFDTLHVDFPKLSSTLGLSDTLKAGDIDFTNLVEYYDANDPDSIKAISAPFKANSNSNLHNYGFTFYTWDSNFEYPFIAKSTTGDSINLYELYDDTVITMNNYNTSNPTFYSYKTNFTTSIMRKGSCGQKATNCFLNVYEKHGWLSVWATIQTLAIWQTGAVIMGGCILHDCILKE